MAMNWFQIPRAILTLRSAVAPIGTTKDWWLSSSIIYQLIVSALVVLSALGIYFTIPAEQIKEVSEAFVIAVPVLLKLVDALIAIRLRTVTTAPITGTIAAQKIAEAVVAPTITTVEVPVGSTVQETIQEIKLAEALVADLPKETPTTGTG